MMQRKIGPVTLEIDYAKGKPAKRIELLINHEVAYMSSYGRVFTLTAAQADRLAQVIEDWIEEGYLAPRRRKA